MQPAQVFASNQAYAFGLPTFDNFIPLQALASLTVDELLSLSSPWPLTAIFGFSAGATAGGMGRMGRMGTVAT
jgi:hypothetical protein